MSIREEKGVRNHLSGTGPADVPRQWFLALFLVLFLVLTFLPGVVCAEIAVRLSPETASLFLYEPFVLRLDVESDNPPEMPELPATPDLAVTTVRRLPPEPARRMYAFQIGLIAGRDGILTVPPFAVRAGDETVLTSPLRLRIRAPRPATEMALGITVEPASLRIGQPATVTVTWTSAVPFARCKQLHFEIPLLADPRCQLFPVDPSTPESERLGLPVNGIRVVAETGILPDQRHRLVFRYKLVPLEPCVLRTQPARIVCSLLDGRGSLEQPPSYFYNQFFLAPDENEAYERIYLAAPVPEVTVRALPESGRTTRFAEIVGPCELHTSIAPVDLVVGQPALFTVALDNLAFAGHIAGLPSAAYDALRPEFQISAQPIRETITDHTRSFTHILRPMRPGIFRIPAIVIQVFHPGTNEYRTLRSEPIPITVAPDPENASLAFLPRIQHRPPIQLNGIQHNRVDEQTMIFVYDTLRFLGRYWWVFVPLAPLVWFALLPLIRRWERCRRDPVYARSVAAWRRFRQTQSRDEESAWRHYLADRLALCAAVLTADSVTRALRSRKVDGDLVAETRRRLEEKDAADYGKRPAALPGATRSLVRRLHKATVPLLLVCSVFVPLQANAADRADELFARALQMREQKPDEAEPLFVEAALGFESAERFLNAGNSWSFAGESGRALANYRAAERRSPFDRQLRKSIDFVRASRTDAFPTPTTHSAAVTAIWKRFCTWAAVLRVGLFVLVYLFAWTLFLAGQLMGWRVRPMAWSMLVVAMLVPLASVAQTSFHPAEGVVIQDTIARLGPSYAYEPAFEQPLHKAAEFQWIETRQGWVRARMPGDLEGWLRKSDCLEVQ